MNALADPEVGKFLNRHFVSAFQKVASFRIVNGQKQGGNVACYFCAQDGRVLHVIAGPVNAKTLLRESRWVVSTVQKSLKLNQETGKSFKAQIRQAHADRLKAEYGLTVNAATFDVPVSSGAAALTYRDPSGKPLAPVLDSPPIEGPDVSLTPEERDAFELRQQEALKFADSRQVVTCRRGRKFVLPNQGRVHVLLAAHAMKKIESVYGSIFEGILGETVSTKPVIVASPFPWVTRR